MQDYTQINRNNNFQTFPQAVLLLFRSVLLLSLLSVLLPFLLLSLLLSSPLCASLPYSMLLNPKPVFLFLVSDDL